MNVAEHGLYKNIYLRRLIMGTEVKAKPSAEIKELRKEVHKIGLNINQIARSMNSGVETPKITRQALFLLGKVYEMMYLIAKR